jgi:hypothetical protein
MHAKRSPAHERAIRRAWAERMARRERADLDSRALAKVNGDNRLLLEQLHRAEAERDELRQALQERAAQCDAEKDRREGAENRLRAAECQVKHESERRAENAIRARRMLTASRAAARADRHRIAELDAEVAKLKLSPTYFDAETGLEKFDHGARSMHHVNLARERAERAEHALAAMQARCERAEEARDRLADAVQTMGTRLANAEAAVRRLNAA